MSVCEAQCGCLEDCFSKCAYTCYCILFSALQWALINTMQQATRSMHLPSYLLSAPHLQEQRTSCAFLHNTYIYIIHITSQYYYVHLSIYLSIYLPTNLSIYLSIYLPISIYYIYIYIYESWSKWLNTSLVLEEFFVRDVHETL